MDYEGLEDELKVRYRTYCDDRGMPYVDEDEEFFIKTAIISIENIMTGGFDVKEAYELYLEQIQDDLDYITREVKE